MAETDWPHLLAEITARRDALNQVIEVLTTQFVRDAAPVVDDTLPRNDTAQIEPAGRTGGILAALRKRNSPMTPRELMTVTQLSAYVLRRRLADLAALGQVTLTGQTANRQVVLGRADLKQEREDSGIRNTGIPTPVRSAVEAVEARDRAILAFLEEGEASFEAVVHATPNEPGWTNGQRAEACTLALRRLRLKNLVSKAGDTWTLHG